MIGELPIELAVNGRLYSIDHDFRNVLNIYEMLDDDNFTRHEKGNQMLRMLYDEVPDDKEEAGKQAAWFLDGGLLPGGKKGKDYGKLFSWVQDMPYIFSGVDKALGYSTRATDYLHWWEFLGGFWDIGECQFSNIVHMRKAKKIGKLTKEEDRQWKENPSLYEFRGSDDIPDQGALLDLINGE